MTSPTKLKGLLLLSSLLLSCGMLELGLRVAQALHKPPLNDAPPAGQSGTAESWAIYDPDLGYRPNPKYADRNAQGLRDRPIGPKADRFRVLFLGDSLAVNGENLDDTFVGHLRGALHADPAFADVDVINGGVKGYTNYQEVMFLKKVGVSLEPDLVGFQFCLNDLFRFLHAFNFENGQLVPGTYHFSTEARQRSERFWVRLAKHSQLLLWLKNNLSVARNAAEWQARRGYSFDYRLDVQTAWQDNPWIDIEKQLDEASALGRARGFRVFLVGFPLAVQYQADYLARDRTYVLKPQRKLREICERLNIPFYDMYPDLGPGAFVADGLHLGPEGRRIAGQKIAAFLERSGLLTARSR